MGRAPAAIIIARHGARLDAEDESWVSNSSTPYDPPLSYGGWTQTRALGGRIASLLHERDVMLNEAEGTATRRVSDDSGLGFSRNGAEKPPTTTPTPRRRKHKVIIHSSPFLRCVQSSIAISAGMAQYQGNLAKFEAKSGSMQSPKVKPHLFTPSRSQTLDPSVFDSMYTNASSSSKTDSQPENPAPPVTSEFMKPTLRIDACLGEWLSPDYFEFITAPPSSNMMVAGAKADLLRRGTPIPGVKPVEDNSTDPPLLDLEGGNVIDSVAGLSVTELPEICAGDATAADRTQAAEKNGKMPVGPTPGSRHKSISKGYVPPSPTYAIGTAAVIPPGFVAHARDACIKLDLQWDSMRYPQEWGDGGEYGEEWSAMHRRFRKGLMNMITWYKLSGPYYDPQAEIDDSVPELTMDDDEDIILVIVTHGAGCNALIGAITNQPVLLDVGMASLTMAVRKEATSVQAPDFASRSTNTTIRRTSSVDCSQSEEYEMRLTASMDHLRAGRDPLKIPQLQSPRVLASIPESNRRQGSSTSVSSTYSAPHEPERARNSALGSVRRNRATTTSSPRSMSHELKLPSPMQTGLWGGRQFSASSHETTTLTEEREPAENDDLDGATAAERARKSSEVRQSSSTTAPPSRTASQRGLWGGGPRKQPVRRWTVIEQN